MRRTISSGSRLEADYAYSRAVVDGDWVLVAGTTGMRYDTGEISDDVAEQAEHAFHNIARVLAEAGASVDDTVRVQYTVTDAAYMAGVAPVLNKWLGTARPAATAVVAGLIDPRMKIEIEVTARKNATPGSSSQSSGGEAMEQRLSIVTLGVEDLPRARAFYEAMGWRVATEENAGSIVCFTLNGIGFALYPREMLAKDVGLPGGTGAATGAVTLAYNVRAREDVAAVLDQAERAGGAIVKPAQDVFWGGHSGYFKDPDGHLWEVAWNPFSPLADDGGFAW